MKRLPERSAIAKRTATRDLVTCGQTWRRRRDKRQMRVRMVHRADRLVELADGGGGIETVGFSELRRYWQLVREPIAKNDLMEGIR